MATRKQCYPDITGYLFITYSSCDISVRSMQVQNRKIPSWRREVKERPELRFLRELIAAKTRRVSFL